VGVVERSRIDVTGAERAAAMLEEAGRSKPGRAYYLATWARQLLESVGADTTAAERIIRENAAQPALPLAA